MLLQAKIILILLALMALMSAGGYAYFKYSQEQLDVQKAKVVVLDIANKTKQLHIEKMEADEKKQALIRAEVDKDFAKARKDVEDMRARFSGKTKSGADKNIGKAAIEKTVIIQTAVNRGTADQNRCFEVLSGSPLTEGETNGTIKNSICPELFPTKPVQPAK